MNKRKVLLVLLVLMLLFIWGNSLLPADKSAALSNLLREILNKLFPTADAAEPIFHSDGILRKVAHCLEFSALGIIIALLCLPVPAQRAADKGLRIICCGLLTALIDETIQLFVSGRSGQISDVWIDLAGYCGGVLIIMLGTYLSQTCHSNKTA